MANGSKEIPPLGPVPAPPNMQSMPPTQNISHLALSLTATEFVLVAGHSRALMAATPEGMTAQIVQEWLLGLSMSPTTALMLLRTLEAGVTQYEDLFGKIPTDPKGSFKVESGPVPKS